MLDNFQAYAEHFIQEHNIPAVSLAVWKDDHLTHATAGILNLNTGVEATADSIFQIGSITKVMTTSLVMQLVDEGLVELDKPVKHYLRDFMIADKAATETITVRQLLNHTNGIAGDYFPDDHGHEGNLIARYVDRCSFLPLVHPPGEGFSYSNAALSIAGRLVEVMRRNTWAQTVKDYIYKPLGMGHAIADPGDGFLFRSAIGHVGSENKLSPWVVPDEVYLTLGQAPAGSTLAMTATDLITFARAHMEGGVNQQGERWLSQVSVNTMQAPYWEQKEISQISSKYQGLGWGITQYHQNNIRTIGHGGATHGFLSNLILFPERNMAFAFLLNSFSTAASEALTRNMMKELADIDVQEPEPEGETDTTFLIKVTGRYSSLDSDVNVTIQGDKLFAHINYKIDPTPPQTLELRHVQGGCYACYRDKGARSANLVFLNENQRGIPSNLLSGFRLHARQGA